MLSLPANGEVLSLKIDNVIKENFIMKNGRVSIEEVGSGFHQFELDFNK